MRRSTLFTILALGALTTALAGSGVFAAGSDTATTDTYAVESASQPRLADLVVAVAEEATENILSCGAFSDDLTTGGQTFSPLTPQGSPGIYACLKNTGSDTLDVAVSILDLVDADVACTSDEGVVDATCGSNGLGELGDRVWWYPGRVPCNDYRNSPTQPSELVINSGVAAPLGPLAPGETGCYQLRISYLATPSQAQLSQSDWINWKYRFHGVSA